MFFMQNFGFPGDAAISAGFVSKFSANCTKFQPESSHGDPFRARFDFSVMFRDVTIICPDLWV